MSSFEHLSIESRVSFKKIHFCFCMRLPVLDRQHCATWYPKITFDCVFTVQNSNIWRFLWCNYYSSSSSSSLVGVSRATFDLRFRPFSKLWRNNCAQFARETKAKAKTTKTKNRSKHTRRRRTPPRQRRGRGAKKTAPKTTKQTRRNEEDNETHKAKDEHTETHQA